MGWEKLGSKKIGARTPDFEATNNTSWTQVGTGITIDSNGKITGAGATANARVYKALGFTSHASNWILDFEFTRTSSGGNNARPIYVSENTNAPADSSDNDTIGAYQDTNFNLFKKEGTTHTAQGWTANTQGTKYYGRLTRLSDTSFKVVMSTSSSDRDAGSGGSVTQSITSSTIGGLSYIGSGTGDHTGNHTWEVENIKFYNGTTTMTNSSDTMLVSGMEEKKHLLVQVKGIGTGGTINCNLTFNGDTGGNYGIRENVNGGSDSTNVSITNTDNLTGTVTGNVFANIHIINIADKEKLFISEGMEVASGAGNAPERKEIIGKWANTSNAITSIQANNSGTGSFAEGSEITVYGTD